MTTTVPDHGSQSPWWSDDYLDLVNALLAEYPDASRPARQRMLQALHDLLTHVTPESGEIDAWLLDDDNSSGGA